MWQHVVELPSNFQYKQMLRRLHIDPLNQVKKDFTSIRVPIYVTSEVVEVVFATSEKSVQAMITGNNTTTKEVVISEVERLFGFEQTFDLLTDHFRNSPLVSVFNQSEGLPLVQEWSLFSCLTKSIIHQQINTSFAGTLTARFVQHFGTEIDGVWFYPAPEVVRKLPVATLRELSFSERKAEYLIEVAKAVTDQRIPMEYTVLEQMSNEEVEKTLCQVRGIGPWTAQSFLLFGLGRKDIFPIGDLGLRIALQREYDLTDRPSKEWMKNESKTWSPYRSFVALYLWRSLERKSE